MDNLLSGGIPSVRASVLSRYCKFFSSVKTSPSLEVRVVANIAAADIRSSVGKNLFTLGKEAGMILTIENLLGGSHGAAGP